MITLYHSPTSCSLAVKAALTISNLNFEVKIIDTDAGEQFSEEFKKINPLSKVPVLIVDGEILTEGAAIMQYIAEVAPNSNLLPAVGSIQRAHALKWMMFAYGNVHPTFARIFAPARFGDNEADVKLKAEKYLDGLFSAIDEQLSHNDFIAGDELTVADLYLGVVIHWQEVLEKSLTEKYSYVADYLKRLMKLPVIGEIYEAELP